MEGPYCYLCGRYCYLCEGIFLDLANLKSYNLIPVIEIPATVLENWKNHKCGLLLYEAGFDLVPKLVQIT